MVKRLRELPVLSIRQPWAWLIVNGHKDIEKDVLIDKRRKTVTFSKCSYTLL